MVSDNPGPDVKRAARGEADADGYGCALVESGLGAEFRFPEGTS